jgi:hypothetical protein
MSAFRSRTTSAASWYDLDDSTNDERTMLDVEDRAT